MRVRVLCGILALFAVGACNDAQAAKRVALVVGQASYANLTELSNPKLDARRMVALLARHGFEVIACEGATPGCFDLTRAGLVTALKMLEAKAKGAELALVFFAGHGMEAAEGNILAPVDASVDCRTWTVNRGVPVEQLLLAAAPAQRKIVVLDACRDNPLGQICPPLKQAQKLAFKKIEPGDMRGMLLVTSTQFGQQALDGLPDAHSPFAAALFAGLEANPSIYFEQVMNDVARATYEAAQKQAGFIQIPGKVVGGEAPADCLAGKGCIGDMRVAALAAENERLVADAAGVRSILAEEAARGRPYTAEQRQKRIAELERTLRGLGTSTDPIRQEAHRLIVEGNIAGGRAMLEATLEADEKAVAEAERAGELDRAAERRRAAARSAHDLGLLARGTEVAKAMTYYQRATRLDAADPKTWNDYASAARNAGHTSEAKAALEQAASNARDANNPQQHYWAILGLGDIARAEGSLPNALRLYQAAAAIGEPSAKAHPTNTGWQRDLSVSQEKIGEVLQAQGNLPAALASFRAALAIRDRLAKADRANGAWQYELGVSNERIGDVHMAQGDLAEALKSYEIKQTIVVRLAKADPANAEWLRDLSVSHSKIGNVLRAQGNLHAALTVYQASLAISDRLAQADPANAGWQHDLSIAQEKIGDVLRAQGNLSSALANYQASLAIRDRLAKADLLNARWQRDLSVAQEKVGDVLWSQDKLPAALASYQASLAIRDRLAKADPANAGWQRDLAMSHSRVATVLAEQGERGKALEILQAGRAMIARLIERSPDNAMLSKDLAWFDVQIAEASKRAAK